MIHPILALVFTTCSPAQPLPQGPGRIDLKLVGKQIPLFSYKPPNHTDGPLVVVFHGTLRNAEAYRDDARPMADRLGALVIAPLFSEKEFPAESYQRGGLVKRGRLEPRKDWTLSLVPRIISIIREREGRPAMQCFLVGHSGGGQFLIRMAGFVTTDAARIVVANPGSLLFPTRDLPYPYGFGGLPSALASDEVLKAYLEQPITLYLGASDRERDRYLDKSKSADRQGDCRFIRGQNAFTAAQGLAKERGWTCNWRLVIAPGVGHDHNLMFNAPEMPGTLFGSSPSRMSAPSPRDHREGFRPSRRPMQSW